MQTQLANRIAESTDATNRSRKLSTFLQLAEARTRQRPVRISFPLRRNEQCLPKRSMLAALGDAEFHEWLAAGDDFADAMHQLIH